MKAPFRVTGFGGNWTADLGDQEFQDLPQAKDRAFAIYDEYRPKWFGITDADGTLVWRADEPDPGALAKVSLL